MGGTYDYLSVISSSSSQESEDARRRLSRSIQDRKLSGSSNYCRESEDCRETCESIYLKASDLNRCYNTRENQVDAIADTFKILINPRRLSDLNDIDERSFSDFLRVGYRGFLDLVDPVHIDEDGDRRHDNWEDLHAYSASTAELLLEWLSEEESMARSLKSQDKGGEIFRHLTCIVGKKEQKRNKSKFCSPPPPFAVHPVNPDKLDGYCDPPPTNSHCHDGEFYAAHGILTDSFDDVTLYTYAKAQDNDSMIDMIDDLICSNNNCISNDRFMHFRDIIEDR